MSISQFYKVQSIRCWIKLKRDTITMTGVPKLIRSASFLIFWIALFLWYVFYIPLFGRPAALFFFFAGLMLTASLVIRDYARTRTTSVFSLVVLAQYGLIIGAFVGTLILDPPLNIIVFLCYSEPSNSDSFWAGSKSSCAKSVGIKESRYDLCKFAPDSNERNLCIREIAIAKGDEGVAVGLPRNDLNYYYLRRVAVYGGDIGLCEKIVSDSRNALSDNCYRAYVEKHPWTQNARELCSRIVRGDTRYLCLQSAGILTPNDCVSAVELGKSCLWETSRYCSQITISDAERRKCILDNKDAILERCLNVGVPGEGKFESCIWDTAVYTKNSLICSIFPLQRTADGCIAAIERS